MEPGRVFSEQEVSALVKRAVELQEQANQEPYKPGVTSDDLKKIAQDLGIEPRYLDQAIQEAASTYHGAWQPVEVFERVVDSELQPEDYDVLLPHLRPFGRSGFSQIGRTLTGRIWTGCSMGRAEITGKGGRTRIRIRSNPVFAGLATFYPALVATMLTVGPLGDSGQAWLGLAISACYWIAAAIGFRWLVRRGHQAARSLVDRLADAIPVAQPELQPAIPVTANQEDQLEHRLNTLG